MNFREYVLDSTINEGFFTKLKNKMKYAGYEISKKDKHYYRQSRKIGLLSRITIIDTDTGDNYVKYEEDDIKTGKVTTVETTFDGWKDEKNITGGWLEYSDDQQGRAFKFIQNVYKGDTKITLRAKTKYILNDTQKITGEKTTFNIAKQKFNSAIDLVDFQGRTTDGNKIAFDPTESEK